jgi:hypothetical protein
MGRIARLLVSISGVILLSCPMSADTTTQKRVVVQAVAGDQLSLDAVSVDDRSAANLPCKVDEAARPDVACPSIHLTVSDNLVKDQLKRLHKGDYLQTSYSMDATRGQSVLKTISHYAVDSADSPFWVLLGSAFVCLLLYSIFSGFNPRQLVIGEDGRYSNSKFQMAVWFFVLITSYVAALWLRLRSGGWGFLGGVDIPKNLLLLSGLSALTFGGAKAITASKAPAAAAAVAAARAAAAPAAMVAALPQKSVAPQPNFFSDLTKNDQGQFDFGDFQMLVVTLIAVATYVALIFNFLGTVEYSKAISLPDVDTTILATFGLGQGAYLAKKAVGEVGKS